MSDDISAATLLAILIERECGAILFTAEEIARMERRAPTVDLSYDPLPHLYALTLEQDTIRGELIVQHQLTE